MPFLLEERIGLIADIHKETDKFKTIVTELQRQKVDRIVLLGDNAESNNVHDVVTIAKDANINDYNEDSRKPQYTNFILDDMKKYKNKIEELEDDEISAEIIVDKPYRIDKPWKVFKVTDRGFQGSSFKSQHKSTHLLDISDSDLEKLMK